MFVRFIVAEKLTGTSSGLGIIQAAVALRDSDELADGDRWRLRDLLVWLDDNMAKPTRFNRTKSKGFYRRETKGIAWLKDTAIIHIAKLREIGQILERYGNHVTMLTEERPGYPVYEDNHQLIAEPFRETRVK